MMQMPALAHVGAKLEELLEADNLKLQKPEISTKGNTDHNM